MADHEIMQFLSNRPPSGDDGLTSVTTPVGGFIPLFEMRPVKRGDGAVLHDEHGHPIIREYVTLSSTSKLSKVVRKVTDHDRTTFADAYRAWKSGEDAPMTGTSVDELPGIARSAASYLKSLSIHTIEHLAALNSQAVEAGGMELSRLHTIAKEWQSRAEGSLDLTSISARLAAMEAQTKELTDQNAALRAQNAALATLTSKSTAPAGPDFAAMSRAQLKVFAAEHGLGDQVDLRLGDEKLREKIAEVYGATSKPAAPSPEDDGIPDAIVGDDPLSAPVGHEGDVNPLDALAD